MKKRPMIVIISVAVAAAIGIVALVVGLTVRAKNSKQDEHAAPCVHEWGEWECGADKNTHIRTCALCGENESAPHAWDGGSTVEGDCTTDTVTTYACVDCGITWVDTVPAHHDWGEWRKFSASEHIRDCKKCDETDTASHAWDGGSTVEGDCTTDTVTTYACADCGETKVQTVPAHHILKFVPRKNPVCDVDGNEAYWECTRCGDYFDDGNGENEITDKSTVVIDGGTHTFGSWVAEIPASCTADGVLGHYGCSGGCGKDFDIWYNEITDPIIPATGHTYGAWLAGTPAGCETTGELAHYHCSACNKNFDESKSVISTLTIPATDHTYGTLLAGTPAGCETVGELAHYHCSACGKNFDESKNVLSTLTINATGHTYGTLLAGTPADCETAGELAHYHCSACGKNFDANKSELSTLTIPATGHTYVRATCADCGDKRAPTVGLMYSELLEDINGKKYYLVTGIGTATETDIVVPAEYNGYPVAGTMSNKENINDIKGAFDKNESITSIIFLYDGDIVIDTFSFRNCVNLRSITLRNVYIRDGGFENCTALEEVVFGKVNEVGNAFNNLPKLKNVYFEGTYDEMQNAKDLADHQYAGNDNKDIVNAAWYIYSETTPATEGNYWHWDEYEAQVVLWRAAD